MRRTQHFSAVCLISIILVACGGGGGGGSTQQQSVPPNAAVGGIWSGTDSVSGLTIIGLVDEQGAFHFIRSDGVQFVGTATTSGTTVNANFEGYAEFRTPLSDGATHGKGTLSGTMQQRASLTASTQFTTDKGTNSNGSISLTFNPIYYHSSYQLKTISGNYTDPVSGDVISVSDSGVMSWQDPASSCVGNGTVSVINASYNVYQVTFDYASCQGPAAVLNGVQFQGLATVDATKEPTQVIIGVTGTAAGVYYSVVFTLNSLASFLPGC